MKTKQVIGRIGILINSFIYIIGWMAIWQYAFDRWPRGTHVIVAAALIAFAVWYFWSYFIHPFWEGLKGDGNRNAA